MIELYRAVSPFEATSLSGSKRHIVPGEVFSVDMEQPGPEVTIELDMSYLVVDLHSFSTCCKPLESSRGSGNRGGSPLDL